MYYNPQTSSVLTPGYMVALYGAMLTPEQAKDLGLYPFTPLECEVSSAFAKRIVFTGSAYEEVLVALPAAVEAVATADAALARVAALEALLVTKGLIDATPAEPEPA
jgi:hypothetical protein